MQKIITNHWGKLDPFKIGDYTEQGGYEALKKFLDKMTAKEAIGEIKASGLRGRGGAGFLMGDKLEKVAQKSGRKYFICNLDESEPGTYKDRLIVDNDPHRLLEGLIISALVVGAEEAYIYLNGNYQKQFEILETAINQAKKNNYLGRSILHSENNLEINLFSGAGAYICGEETALINSLEGNRGEPRLRPPYPTEKGLFGFPTVVNNAETIANVPWIISNGGEAFSKIGSQESPGTKLYVLAGAVKNKGVFEGLTGMTLREVIDQLGGGLAKGKEFWFAQIGGACGKLVLEKELDAKINYEITCQCPPGSGSIFVADKSVNIYEIILSWADFFRRESCGKCVPCREGTFRLFEIAKRFQDGNISDRDKTALKDILWSLENTAFCPFGRFAATAMKDAVDKLKVLDKN